MQRSFTKPKWWWRIPRRTANKVDGWHKLSGGIMVLLLTQQAYLNWTSQHPRAISIVHMTFTLSICYTLSTTWSKEDALLDKTWCAPQIMYWCIGASWLDYWWHPHHCNCHVVCCSIDLTGDIFAWQSISYQMGRHVSVIWHLHTWCYVLHLVHVSSKIFSKLSLIPHITKKALKKALQFTRPNKRRNISLYM